MHLLGKDSNQKREPSPEEAPLDYKALGDRNLEKEQALQLANLQPPLHIVEVMEQKESVLRGMLEQGQVAEQAMVQQLVPELGCQLVVDDGIYRLLQTCTALFSSSMNTLSHPETVTQI